jgi:tetratricopeptide (TPR) repeat protein
MNMGDLAQAKDILAGLLDQPDFLSQGGSAQQVQPLLSACLLMLDAPNDLLELMDTWDDVAESGFLSSHRATALIRAGSVAAACSAIKEGAKRFPDYLPFRRAASMQLGMGEGAPYDAKAAADVKRAGLESSAYLAAEFRQWEKCLGAIDEIHGLSPIGDVELLLLKSNALELLGRRDEALNALWECHSLEPGHPTVQNNLGYHLLELDGDVLEASKLISAALSQEPGNASYMDSWGWALFKQGKLKEAEAALRKAVEANPLSPEIRKHLGEALLKLDRPQEALEQWERAMAFASTDRKGLEGRVSKLRTELAKKALEENGPGRPDSDSDSDDDDDDGWMP